MTPEFWGRIKGVFQGALERASGERPAFVDAACGSDDALKREVVRLLNDHREEFSRDSPVVQTGSSISHYEVIEKIGEGGMGVVYKALDTTLRRIVALKFLRWETIGSEHVRTRLLNEARSAAALDHPNVCTVYEIGEADGYAFLAMAWVDGESVSERVRKGPVPLGEALRIAGEIAEGLHAAHEAGIVHRDIKSANVMITNKGQVKIMDFGLAHLASETHTTTVGRILGTPAFMSPEQVRGEDLDQRTDIWSLAVVLYEMLTGRLPFTAGSPQSVALAILNQEPEPVTSVRAGTPSELDFVLAKALAKDREERYQRVSDLLIDLRVLAKRIASPTLPAVPGGRARATVLSRRARRHRLPWAVAAVATAALCTLLSLHLLGPAGGQRDPIPRRFEVHAPVPIRASWSGQSVAISPDGNHIAMAANNGKLWVHDLQTGKSRALEGTESGEGPFWSPDSENIGYAANNELMRIRCEGGAPSRLCPLPRPRFHGGTWSPDGTSILFASSDELYEVPSGGGTARMLKLPAGTVDRKYYPTFLPATAGSRVLLFAGGTGKLTLYLYNLQTNELKPLGPGCKPSWSSSGHILYQPSEFVHELWALPFSAASLQPSGKPFVVARSALEPSVANDGTLVHRASATSTDGVLTWVDRRTGGKIDSIRLDGVVNLGSGALSPDGTRVAYHGRAASGAEFDIWIYDLLRGTNFRLTSDDGRDLGPLWSPSGVHVVFTSNRDGPFRIYMRRADGTGETKALTKTGNNFANDWSFDGKYILYEETSRDRFGDIWFLVTEDGRNTWQNRPYLQTEHGERFASLSPNGKYVAYLSIETGREELYVRTFPEGSRRWTVSSGGAFSRPRWRRDGRELFYVSRGNLMAVPVTSDRDFSMGTPRPILPSSGYCTVSANGQRVLVGPSEEYALDPNIRIIQNWHSEFRGRR